MGIAGIGHLGWALANYKTFGRLGFRTTGLFDVDHRIIGQNVGGVIVTPISEMDKVTQQNASLVEEASAAAASLEEQGARLTEAVGAFRLSSTKPGRAVMSAPVSKNAPLRPAATVSGDNWETF